MTEFLTAARLFERSAPLTTKLMDTGGRLDTTGIQDLITEHCTATTGDHTLTDVAIELLRRFVTFHGVRS